VLSADAVRRIIGAVLSPAHFFVGPNLELDWEFGAAIEVAWEIFQGRLLDPAHTRCRRAFKAWQVFLRTAGQRSAAPILAVLVDAADQQVHVIRALDSYAWEGYDAGDNVFLSREVRKWVRELVGSLPLAQFSSAEDFHDELMGRVFQAVVGTSRLPLTSVEAPLPAFSLGELAYCYRSDVPEASGTTGPMRSFRDLLEGAWKADLSRLETVKLVEILLRATPAEDLPEAAALFRKCWPARSSPLLTMPGLFRELFNAVALSPYTDFVDKTLAFLRLLVDQGGLTVEEHVDFLGYLLRQIARHLTAYDLVTFHHQGANYPDILLLDAVLKEFRERMEQRPELWLPVGGDAATRTAGRLRRRALRMGWLMRRHYEGHLVPDAPTSPGENARVLPAPHVRVPEEQIRDPATRTRHLFQNDPLAADLPASVQMILRESLKDLHHAAELQELGLAIFLDRPLGVFHRPGEPDQTPLLSYEAFSRTLALRRLQELADWGLIAAADRQADEEMLRLLHVDGVRPPLVIGRPRPGTVSLADTFKVADDFVILRTIASSLRDFLGLFDFTILAQQFRLDFLAQGRRGLVMRLDARNEGGLVIFDDQLRRRLELRVEGRSGYAARGGVEFPVGGLRVVRVWDTTGEGEVLREYVVDLTIPVSGFPAG
jgi:hypothetical protein